MNLYLNQSCVAITTKKEKKTIYYFVLGGESSGSSEEELSSEESEESEEAKQSTKKTSGLIAKDSLQIGQWEKHTKVKQTSYSNRNLFAS